jgi:predicted transcriptional regulator
MVGIFSYSTKRRRAEQLLKHDFIKARGHKNEIFELTTKGFETADTLQGSNNP